jgi:hypothetical protein
VCAVAAHKASYEDPIDVRRGDRVLVGRRDDGFPGWAWCIGPDGREGWMPEVYLTLGPPPQSPGRPPRTAPQGSDSQAGGAAIVRLPPPGREGVAFAAVDYDAREMTVEPGTELTVTAGAAGWLLCEREGGGRGWIPAAAVAPLAT